MSTTSRPAAPVPVVRPLGHRRPSLALGFTVAAGLLGSVGFGLGALFVRGDSFASGFLGGLAALGLIGAGEAVRQLLRQRALVFELKGGQHQGTYEVEVTLTPRSSVRVTGVSATLQCVSTSANAAEPRLPSVSVDFVVAQALFQGSATLGHRERLSRKATLPLPPSARSSSAAGAEPSIHYELSVRVEVDGALFIEHDERVKIAAAT